MTDSVVEEPEVKAQDDKPVPVEDVGHVNVAFDMTTDCDVSPASVITFHNCNETAQPEDIPTLTDHTEAKQKTDTELVKEIGLLELVSHALVTLCDS